MEKGAFEKKNIEVQPTQKSRGRERLDRD